MSIIMINRDKNSHKEKKITSGKDLEKVFSYKILCLRKAFIFFIINDPGQARFTKYSSSKKKKEKKI